MSQCDVLYQLARGHTPRGTAERVPPPISEPIAPPQPPVVEKQNIPESKTVQAGDLKKSSGNVEQKESSASPPDPTSIEVTNNNNQKTNNKGKNRYQALVTRTQKAIG
jgi:hypothetical protein